MNFNKERFLHDCTTHLRLDGVDETTATTAQLHVAVSKAVMAQISDDWTGIRTPKPNGAIGENKRCGYFSAEFLVGRAVYSNLFNLGVLKEVYEFLKARGVDIARFEEVEDRALGNGGLGRLAACFLESGATQNLPLDGYGLRYRYGLFKQKFQDGFQVEEGDDWLAFGDPWSIRKENERERVDFADFSVYAVPYDTPVIGYGGGCINTLRLWQSEPIEKFDFSLFDEMRGVEKAERNFDATSITDVLYPNDNQAEGKLLRLRQQYFLVSASLQNVIKRTKAKGATTAECFKAHVFQLNDTHPTLAIPECIRLLEKDGCTFDEAFGICQNVFCFTNHTILGEALEKWQGETVRKILPEIWSIIEKIEERLQKDGLDKKGLFIVKDDKVHMANLALYVCKKVNGVAEIHTDILRKDTFRAWHETYPNKIVNVTNGITPRRWFLLNNRKMAKEITKRIGETWKTDLREIAKIKPYIHDSEFREKFLEIKRENKRRLSEYVARREGIYLPERFIFDVQIKRLHEYKRQLLNALSILYIYQGIKDGTIPKIQPTAFIFGAKSAPGYYMAKAIIKFINEIAKKINADADMHDIMRVVFVQNYNVSYAEKMVCGADVSEQISMAGMEASGTGNMKFMLNGTVTLGTLDGANVEICEEAGINNNYIFGATVSEVEEIKRNYQPMKILEKNPALKRAVNTLIDGTFHDNGTGTLKAIYDSLLCGSEADRYLVLYDFESYVQAKLKLLSEYGSEEFTTKCLENMASAGKFSADRSIKEYAERIWDL